MLELIIKFSGDIESVAKKLGGDVEVLGPGFAILTIDESKVPQLSSYSEIEYVEAPKNVTLNLSISLYHACIAQAVRSYGLSGKGTIVALIDSGIDYTHPDFKNADGTTRVLYLWDMTRQGSPPQGFRGGHLYTAADLNAALANPDPLSVIPQIDIIGHGTAVGGVAAGNGAGSGGDGAGVAPEAALVVIKLGRQGDIKGARTVELMRGLKFAADMAVKENMPCAVNISFGTNEGAHDGNSLFEQYVNEIAGRTKMSIVAAAGNEGSAGHHFSGTLAAGESETVEFTVSGGIYTMYMVLWKDFVDEFNMELISPRGESSGIIKSVEKERVFVLEGVQIRFNLGQPTHYNVNQEIYVQFRGANREIGKGIWKFNITAISSVDGSYHIWLPTAEEVTRGTAFTRPDPFATVTMPATAASVIAVGAYDANQEAIGEFSGRGMLDSRTPLKPDIAAPGVNVLAPRLGGGYDNYTGTSIAAPFVTGSAALLMEWGIIRNNDQNLYGQRLKAFLRLGANRSPDRKYPNESWGYGTLCLKSTLDHLSNQSLERGAENGMSDNFTAAQVNNADIPLYEYAQMPDIIDITVRFDKQFRAYMRDRPSIKLGKIYSGGWAVVYLPESMLDQLSNDLNLSLVTIMPKALILLGRDSLAASGILQVQRRPHIDLKGRGVLLGFIDTGIDYTKEAFLYEDGTSKIRCIWDQTISTKPVENGVLFGTEYSQEQINAALKEKKPLPHQDTVGHGTFISSVAGGREDNEYIGAAPDSEIIMVKLRKLKPYYVDRFRVIKSQENVYSGADIILGINYIMEKAQELGRPVSICISVGTSFGSHDGYGALEEYITELSRLVGVAISVGAGNESNTRRHAQGTMQKRGDVVDFEMRVGENVPAAVAWIWSTPQDIIYLSVKSPTGEIVTKKPGLRDEVFSQKLVLEKSVVSILYYFPHEGSGNNLMVVYIDNPTPGLWTITATGELILDGNFNAWIPSKGLISDDVEFLTANPSFTITNPGVALGAITCGAYDHTNNSLYPPSSWGPSRAFQILPELVAPGVDIKGVYPWGYGTMSGTSVSAAITTGAAALMLQWGIVGGSYPTLNNLRIRAFLIQGCARETGVIYPNEQWGYGRLDLMQTFNVLRRM